MLPVRLKSHLSGVGGFATMEAIISGVIGVVLFTGYYKSIATQAKLSNALHQKALAESYAEELAELFRSMNAEEMQGYLSRLNQTVQSCPQIPGDFNLDGRVTTEDEALYNRYRGTNYFFADANHDGIVNDEDLRICRQNRGVVSQCGAPYCGKLAGDYDSDGDVDNDDLTAIDRDNPQGEGLARRDELVRNQTLENLGRVASCGRPVGRAPRVQETPKPYALCEYVNLAPSYTERAHLGYSDSIADLPRSSPLINGHRKFQVQVVNMDSLKVEDCGRLAIDRSPAANEAYLVTSEVTWGENEKVHLNMLIPGTVASTPTPTPTPAPSSVICSANYRVSSKLNPYLAGMPDGTSIRYRISPGSRNAGFSEFDVAPQNSPVLVAPTDPSCIQGGSVLTFEVSGRTTSFLFPEGPVNADGRPQYPAHHMTYGYENGMSWRGPLLPGTCQATARNPGFPNGSYFGKSDSCVPISSMGGVFLDDSDPSTLPPPPALDYRTSASRNQASYSPMLRQLFYIGDGRTSTGELQRFIVPAGATRLYVYMGNGWQWNDSDGELSIRMNWVR